MKRFFEFSYAWLYVKAVERNLPARPKWVVLKEITVNLARIIFRLHY